MELETLEVLLDINTARVEQSLERALPQIEGFMNRIQQISGKSMDRTEKNMDIEKGASNFTKQLEKMNQTLEKKLTNFERSSKKTSESVGDNFSTGVRKARPKVTKEIDAMVNEINAKMGQAKAAQEKVAYLKSQRQTASNQGDTGKVVKYDEQIARAQGQMTKYQDQAKGLANTIKREFDAVPSSLDVITKSMAQNEGQIESMRKRIKTLKAEYADQRKPVGSFSGGFKGYEDTPQSLKTSTEIDKQSSKMGKLIGDNDRLQKEYAQTEDRAASLRKALQRINTALGQSSIQTGDASSGVAQTGSGLKQSERAVSKYGGVFNRMSNAVSHGFGSVGNGLKNSLGFIGKFGSLFSSNSNKVTSGTNRMTNSTFGLGRSMQSLLRSIIIYQLIGKAVRSLAQGMMSALKTNDQFNSSLNQIKVNLLTAFYPIYTAILPAVNALMNSIAQLTGQFASFVAMLFGTSYEAAKQGASGLYENVQALNDTESSAGKASEKVKELKRSLMGFDQINKLDGSEDEKETSKPSVDFGSAIGNYTTPKWMKDVQKILKDFFKPFQDAWKNQGKRVIDAWKNALNGVIGLAKAIGKSFMEVWTNGTGQRFVENLLILLSDVLNIIGDIANAFKRAWEDNGRGTALIQSIFDMWNGILELLHSVAQAFREAWNDGTGEAIAANLLEIFTNIFNTIGNIANQLQKAWESNNVGQEIFSIILGIINDILGHINNMTKATEEWAKTLDFTPLLNSIKGLLESVEPLADNIGSGLEWFYKNVLLPLASYAIEDLIPAFLDALAGAIDLVNGIIEGSKPAFKFLWNDMLKPIAEWTGGVIVDVLKGLGDALSAIGDWISKHSTAFSAFVTVFVTFVGALKIISAISTAVGVLSSLFSALSALGGLSGILSALGTAIGGIVAVLGGPITLAIAAAVAAGVLLWQNWDWIKEKAGEIGAWIGEKWDALVKITSEAWGNVKKWTSEKWNQAKDAVTNTAKGMYDTTKTKFTEIATTVKDKTEDAKKWASTKWDDIKTKTSSTWEDIKSKTSNTWNNVGDKIRTSAENAKTNATNAWSTMKDKIAGFSNSIKETTKKAFDAVTGWAGDLGKKMGDGLTKGFDAVKRGAKEIAKGVINSPIKAVNGVLGGVRWVLEKVGASGVANGIKDFSLPAYAKGTGHHPGGFALVNDGLGSNYREAYQTPDGRTGIFPAQRNLMVNLPKGTSVLSGPQTAATYGMPAYANGIGDWFSDKWNQVKEFTGDVWDYATNPGKLLNIGISKLVKLGGVMDPSLSIAQGAIGKTTEAATNFVKEKMDSFFSSNDSFDGSIGSMGVYKYLSDIAQKVIDKFPGMRMTSGLREGDPYYHGKRQAIDIAFPASMNGGPDNVKAANYAFDTFASKVGYVITNGKVRDRSGMSGTGRSGSWVHWPDNDHYDHVHINGLLGANDIGAGGSSPSGSGVERWRSTIQRALSKNGLPADSTYTNAWLRQVQSESGGNEKAVQGGYTDVNTLSGDLAKGLLQTISATFNAYKHPGYNNIFNGFDNALAAINYAKNRYGSSGMLQVIGHGHGYAKGTPWLPEDQLAMIHKGEMVVPSEYNPMNGKGYDTIQLPELFRQEVPEYNNQVFDTQNVGNYGTQTLGDTFTNAIMKMIQAMTGAQAKQNSNGDIIINIGGTTLAKITVDEINKLTKQLGYNPLYL